jgi:hypothetical protein
MKKWIILAVLALATTVFAGASQFRLAGPGRTAVQGFAPNGLFSQILTVYSTSINMTDYLAYSLYAPTACKIRLMPTSAKSTYVQNTIESTVPYTRVVNTATPFVNFSGCALGELQIQ